jgi:hypothetical protein
MVELKDERKLENPNQQNMERYLETWPRKRFVLDMALHEPRAQKAHTQQVDSEEHIDA